MAGCQSRSTREPNSVNLYSQRGRLSESLLLGAGCNGDFKRKDEESEWTQQERTYLLRETEHEVIWEMDV